MATKLFLRNTQTNGITGTGDGILYDLTTSAGAASDTSVTNTTAGGTEIQATKTAGGSTVAWISGRAPAGGFTLTATDISLWQVESNMNANIGGRYRVFKRAANGTITEIGGGPFNDGVEMQTTNTEDTWAGNVTDTAFAEDDRILIRYYLTNAGTMGSGHTGTLTFNAADGTTGDSFFNIAETVSFKPDDITAALTGVSLTASPGTLAIAHDQGVTGNAATSAIGSVAVDHQQSLTGDQITGAVGSVTFQVTNLFNASLFAVSADAALSTYIGQMGETWIKHPHASYAAADLNIDAASDRVYSTGTIAYYASGIPASADYYAECDFFAASIIAVNIGPAVRMDTTANTMYTLRLRDGIDWQIRKHVNDTPTLIGSSTNLVPTAGQSKRGRIVAKGDQIWAEVDDVLIIGPITDTDITAAGRAGFRAAGAASASTGFHVSNFKAGNGGGGFVALTGVAASAAVGSFAPAFEASLSTVVSTTALGSLAPSLSSSLSGVESVTAVGTVTADTGNVTVNITGVAAAGSVGSVGAASAVAASGVSAAVSAGNLAPALAVTLAGLESAAAAGLLSPTLAASLTGVSAAVAVNSLGVSVSVGITGNQAIGAVGVVSTGNDTFVNLSGVVATGSAGTLSHSRTVALAGVEALPALGTFGISKGGSAALSGVQSVADVGSLAPELAPVLSGVNATGSAGVLVAARVAQLSGVNAVVEAGSLSVSVSIGLNGVGTVGAVGSLGIPVSSADRVNDSRRSLSVASHAPTLGVVNTSRGLSVKHGR